VKQTQATQDEQYHEAIVQFGAALGRLAGGYERDPHLREDLLQEIHLELWRSFARYEGRCSLRTWVYRVAHNTATTYVTRQQRRPWEATVAIDDIGDVADPADPAARSEDRLLLERLTALIHALKPLDRQVILLYLEGLDAASTGEITGLSAGAVATKVHRIKKLLARSFDRAGNDD
jgi:RNA polymerase sigma-70 factor, ECF subfamily